MADLVERERGMAWLLVAVLCAFVLMTALPSATHAAAPTGACCMANGSCADTLDFACQGDFIGVGTTCATVTCAAAAPALSVVGLLLLAVLMISVSLFRLRRRMSRRA